NYIVHAYWIPNDPYYSYQWHLTQINMPSAWDIEKGGSSNVIVAVLDTGVAYEDYGSYKQAPDLAGTNFVSGYDFVNDDSHPNDDNGHGTHVTGTIAQTTNNGVGVAGVAFNCSIMPVKVLDAQGSGTHQQVADGLYWAVNNGAKVINCSLGGTYGSTTLYNAIKYAYDHGVIIVAAAGNDGSSSISYPAAYDECIAVGAVRYDKTRAYYSNYGTGIELMAPGGDTSVDQNGDGYVDGVLQQTFSGGDPTNFSYWFWQGTSMATPHVTGIVALMLSHGATGIENIRNILHSTAEDLGDPGYDNEYGYGLVDAAAALSYTEYPDLTITAISYSSTHLNEPVDIYVTIANQGTQDVTEDFYVDIYYDPSETPAKGETSRKEKGQIGDDWQHITQIIPAGESIQISFTHTFTTLGEHEIWTQVDTDDSVTETNEDNNIYGPESITVEVPPGDGTTTYWAVIAGVSDYLYINDLNYCDDDAQDIYNTLLADPNWNSSHMQLLIDSQATKSAIHSAINNILSGGFDQDDVLLFYFSGHGTYYYDQSPIDETDGYDEYICPYDMDITDLSTGIRDDELEDWLNVGINGVVTLDTCNSGGFIKLNGLTSKCIIVPGLSKKAITKGDGFTKDLQDISNLVTLTACDDNESAEESTSLQHGVFTYYLLEALDNTSTDINSNNKISAEEAFTYASPKATDFNPDQHPQISDKYSGELDLINTPFADLVITGVISTPNPSVSGQQVQVTVEFKNQGNADAGSFWIDLYKDRDTAPTKGQKLEREKGLTGDYFTLISSLAKGATGSTTFTYTYNTPGTKKIWAQIDTDDYVTESNEDNNIYGPYDQEVTIPSITHTPIASATYNEPILITAEVSSEVGISSAKVYSRKGGEGEYTSISMSNTSSYQATIPSTYLTERGLEYYIKAEDIYGNIAASPEENASLSPYTVRVNFSSLSFPFTTQTKKWQMISVPVELDSSDPNSVLVDDLGEQDNTKWKFYRWNTDNGTYDEYLNIPDNFTPGKAFWLITRDQKSIDVGQGKSTDTSSDYAIDLAPGWSQIANPFAFSVNWNDVKVKRNGETLSVQQAQVNGWIRDTIWYWDGNEYIYYQAPDGVLEPWKGYWVKALLSCTLLVSPLESEETKILSTSSKSCKKYLQIIARVGELKDSYNFIGLSSKAKDTYDKEDIEEAPAIFPYISLSFPHSDWGKDSGSYTQDIRGIPNTKSYPEKIIWNMQVKTDQLNKTITLEWKNTDAIPEEYNLYLTVDNENVLCNMRKVNTYSFVTSTGKDNFRIVATTEKLSPLSKDLTLTEVYTYPNPANNVANIHFSLGKDANVTIRIYTISGELVKTFVENKSYPAGSYTEVWQLDNEKGERIARGVYILLIKATGSSKTLIKTAKVAVIK
ncbi:hypothetical protein DRI96_00280, partial [Candidatus Aerophobetes bacterium]